MIVAQCRRSHRQLPKELREAPELFLGNEFWYECFVALSSCRASGWGRSGLSFLQIVEYGGYIGLDEEQMDDLIYFMRVMDNAYLKFYEEKDRKKE